jgi:hypothetical protein
MTKNRTIHVIAVGGLAIALLAGADAVASASPRQGTARPHTIHIVTTLSSAAVNSAGLGGAADVGAQVFTFPLPGGASGHIDASVTLMSPSEQLSHVAFVFPNGQIDAQAAITLPPTHFVAAIIGGTGAYEGVGGQVVNTVTSTAPLTIDRTLDLIYPGPADD